MGKKAQKVPKKKGEFFFNFNQLRRKLNAKQKQKLISFFSNFRSMFLTVKQHLFQVNKMYDLMEQEFKKFQRDLFKNDEYLSHGANGKDEEEESQKEGEEFKLDDDIMKQLLEEGLKDEKDKDIDKNGEINDDKQFLEKCDINIDDEILEKKEDNKQGDNQDD